MIETWNIPVRPLTGRTPRKVYVYLPRQAEEDPEARFPVLYMFDGHNVFFDEDATYGKSRGMKEYLEGTGVGLIVVAVDCDHRPPNGRLCEYSPFSFRDREFGAVTGRGKRFMDWLTETLKPIIDRKYPTRPEREYTWIAGSSMGGLMSLYAVTAYNQVFSRAAALSPSVWLVRGKMLPFLRKVDMEPGTVIYMDYGSREMDNHQGMMRCFTNTASILTEKARSSPAASCPTATTAKRAGKNSFPSLCRFCFITGSDRTHGNPIL